MDLILIFHFFFHYHPSVFFGEVVMRRIKTCLTARVSKVQGEEHFGLWLNRLFFAISLSGGSTELSIKTQALETREVVGRCGFQRLRYNLNRIKDAFIFGATNGRVELCSWDRALRIDWHMWRCFRSCSNHVYAWLSLFRGRALFPSWIRGQKQNMLSIKNDTKYVTKWEQNHCSTTHSCKKYISIFICIRRCGKKI